MKLPNREAFTWRVVEGDNFGGDYPNEKFVNIPPTTYYKAEKIAKIINDTFCARPYATRYWRVVNQDYILRPGFTP